MEIRRFLSEFTLRQEQKRLREKWGNTGIYGITVCDMVYSSEIISFRVIQDEKTYQFCFYVRTKSERN